MPTEDTHQQLTPEAAADIASNVRSAVSSVYLDHASAIDAILRAIVARGHVLLEDVPGVGKTVLATAVARALDCTVSRVQMTPDLMPSDIVGTTIIEKETGAFAVRRGPIFTNVLVADEINRTTPRTQSALLEAMSERTVSIDGKAHPLEEPFIVLATQNPYEFEGTYPLPENQLDRFFVRLKLGYPSAATETEILDRRPGSTALPYLEPVASAVQLVALQHAADQVTISKELLDYIVTIANATRRDERIQVGLSPRGSLALAQSARAAALLAGRAYAIPEDITDHIDSIVAHRLVLRAGYAPVAETANDVLRSILAEITSPV